MLGVLALFERQITNLTAVAFTSLVLAELLNVTSEIVTWHPLMILAEILTVFIYGFSLVLLPEYFDITVRIIYFVRYSEQFITTTDFWSRVAVITLVSWLPVHSYKVSNKHFGIHVVVGRAPNAESSSIRETAE